MPDFLTIKAPSEGVYKEKGSKFFAYAYPITSENEAQAKVKSLKKEFYDARHHCYAFTFGKDQEKFRAADDGEPANSAGAPILGQIRSFNLTNVLVVVVRYFGGTKLGVPGLINAYKTSTKDALQQAEIIEGFELLDITLHFDYFQMNEVMKTIKDYNLKIVHRDFNLNCVIHLIMKKTNSETALKVLEENSQKIELRA